MTEAGSTGSDDRGISNLGFRISDLKRSSLKFEIRNPKSEIYPLCTLHSQFELW